MSWRRTETRVVRPFETYDQWLADTAMKLLPNAEFDLGPRVEVEESDLPDVRPEFRIALAEEASKLDSEADLRLVIRVSDSNLHHSEVIFQEEPRGLPETWQVPDDIRKRLPWSLGTRVSVALVLASDREQQPGKPWKRGQWIARKDFLIGPKPTRGTFPIQRWSPEEFRRQGLPRETVWWVEFLTEDLNETIEDASEALQVCLREDVHNFLSRYGDKPVGRAVGKVLLSEVLAQLLLKGLAQIQSEDQIKRDSLLGAVVTRIRKATGVTEGQLIRLAREGDVLGLKAFCDACVETRRALLELRG